jgi:hypothetical protein
LDHRAPWIAVERQHRILRGAVATDRRPDKSLPGGPELDIVLDGDRCVAFVEAEWDSAERRRQGIARDTAPIQLRRDVFAK